MKTLVFCTLLLSTIAMKSMKNDTLPSTTVVYSGKLVTISAEKILYETGSSNNFYLKFKIENKTTKIIGVDLGNFEEVIHPQQYHVSKTPTTLSIDIILITPNELNKVKKKAMREKYTNQKLTFIQPNQSIDYCREFNGGFNKADKEKIKINEQEYLIIMLDGQFFATDGQEVENVCFCKDAKDKSTNRELSISYPIVWKKISSNGFVLENKK